MVASLFQVQLFPSMSLPPCSFTSMPPCLKVSTSSRLLWSSFDRLVEVIFRIWVFWDGSSEEDDRCPASDVSCVRDAGSQLKGLYKVKLVVL